MIIGLHPARQRLECVNDSWVSEGVRMYGENIEKRDIA